MIGVVRRSWLPLLIIQLCAAVVGALVTYTLFPQLSVAPDGSLRGPGGVPLVPVPGEPGGLDSGDQLRLLIGLAISLAVMVFAHATSVYVVIRDAAGRPVATDAALRFAGLRAPAMVGWYVIALVLTGIGVFLLFVPGIFLAIVFSATLIGVVTVERGTLARCFVLVARRFLPTAGRMLLTLLARIVYTYVATFVVGALSQPNSFNEALLSGLALVPVGMVTIGVVVVTYAELRFHENPTVRTSTLADDLDRSQAR